MPPCGGMRRVLGARRARFGWGGLAGDVHGPWGRGRRPGGGGWVGHLGQWVWFLLDGARAECFVVGCPRGLRPVCCSHAV